MTKTSKLLTIVVCCAIITGCSSQGNYNNHSSLSGTTAPSYKEVKRSHLEANKQLKLAQSSSDPSFRNYYFLMAAENYLDAKEYSQAQFAIDSVEEIPVDSEEAALMSILKAKIAIHHKQFAKAERMISNIWSTNSLPEKLKPSYLIIKARIAEAKSDVMMALEYRLQFAKTSPNEAELARNKLHMWKILGNLLPSELNALSNSERASKELRGWISMAKVSRQYDTDPKQLERSLSVWQNTYPEHPAFDAIYGQNYQNYAGFDIEIQKPNKIGLLLPLSDEKYGAGAKAIRDGFLAAHYTQKSKYGSISVSIIDTTKDGVGAAYDKAIAEGADFIVGPLLKDNINELIKTRKTHTPILSLNNIKERFSMPKHMFQFGLSPEQEADFVAVKAAEDGHKYAIVIVPDNAWGERLEQAFSNRWQSTGGNILEVVKFKNHNDLNSKLENAFGLKESKIRSAKLSKIGIKHTFSPRRRQDIDFIYMGANPKLARQIKPLINFHYASNLPVYASSSIYEARQQPSKDQDLNNIIFCDMPWVLDGTVKERKVYRQIKSIWPHHLNNNPRLVALGIDAYKVANELHDIALRPYLGISGMSGMLYLDNKNVINRELLWAKITKGRAKLK